MSGRRRSIPEQAAALGVPTAPESGRIRGRTIWQASTRTLPPSDTAFTPEGSVTRAMLYTVMARFDDADVVTTGANWYADSLEWAKANNVSDGTNPTGNITREQLATMLYRYVGEPAATGSTDSYADAGSVSDYAATAMQWAVENGLINGINGRLQPQGYATRAQLAAIMQRFCANVMF